MGWTGRWTIALGVCVMGLLLLAVLDTKVPGTVMVGIGMFLIPGLSFWSSQRREHRDP